jgi:hypothetical protein
MLERMESAIEKAGPGGLLQSKFTEMFKHERDRRQHLQTLLEADAIALVKGESTGGRVPMFLIHPKYCPAR